MPNFLLMVDDISSMMTFPAKREEEGGNDFFFQNSCQIHSKFRELMCVRFK